MSLELSDEQIRHVLWRAVCRYDLISDLGKGELSDTALRAAARRALVRASRNGPFSHALIRGFLVLSVFEPGGQARGVSEVAEELDMKISTVHRVLRTLAAISLLQHDKDSRQYRRPTISQIMH